MSLGDPATQASMPTKGLKIVIAGKNKRNVTPYCPKFDKGLKTWKVKLIKRRVSTALKHA